MNRTIAKTAKIAIGSLAVSLLAAPGLMAQDASSVAYEQRINVVYGEVHGTGLLMDVFTPKEKANGLGIIDVVSGAYHSDRGKIRDHIMAQVYTFCAPMVTRFLRFVPSKTAIS